MIGLNRDEFAWLEAFRQSRFLCKYKILSRFPMRNISLIRMQGPLPHRKVNEIDVRPPNGLFLVNIRCHSEFANPFLRSFISGKLQNQHFLCIFIQ